MALKRDTRSGKGSPLVGGSGTEQILGPVDHISRRPIPSQPRYVSGKLEEGDRRVGGGRGLIKLISEVGKIFVDRVVPTIRYIPPSSWL